MDNNQKVFDYSFPNAKVSYWFYFSPMFFILFVYIIIFRHELIVDKIIDDVYINLFCLLLLSIVIMPLLAYIFANSFPAIRVKIEGLEIEQYSPFKSKWIFIQWNEIDKIDEYTTPVQKFLRQNKKWLFIKSKRLPSFYIILSLIYRHSMMRGFIVSPKINNFEILAKSIYSNYKGQRKVEKKSTDI